MNICAYICICTYAHTYTYNIFTCAIGQHAAMTVYTVCIHLQTAFQHQASIPKYARVSPSGPLSPLLISTGLFPIFSD